MVLGRRTQRRLVITGLAALLAAPAFVVVPADAAIAFTCDSVTGSAVFSPGLVHDTRPQSLSSGPTAPAGPANVTLASTSDTGAKGNGNSYSSSVSADGTKVAFTSAATNLDPVDIDSIDDIYVKDLSTGDIRLVSTSDTGVKGNGASGFPSLTVDGTAVLFSSAATNLDPVDTDSLNDVYLKDLTTGDIRLVSTSDTGLKGNGASGYPGVSLSADATMASFTSNATNLDAVDTDAADDVYVKDLDTGDLMLASTSDLNVKGNGESYAGTMSPDGTTVFFDSRASNLDPADTNQALDIFSKELTTGDLSPASPQGNRASFRPRLSADGTTMAFVSTHSNLDPADTDGLADIYVKDLVSGEIALASTSDAGIKQRATADLPAISGDGTKVAFMHSSALDPADTNYPYYDIYVKNLTTGDLTLASASANGVAGDSYAYLPSMPFDGSRVAFHTGAHLDPTDTDERFDIYVKDLPSVPTSIDIDDCSNGNSGTASIVDIRSYGPRPLGCPVALGGAAGNDYADTTPILVGTTLSMTIDWATGPNSYGIAAAKAGPTGTQWRFRLAITASSGHDTPATNQYLPIAGSGFTKTRLQGKLDFSALDSFNCTSGVSDPLSWVDLANNGTWVAKAS